MVPGSGRPSVRRCGLLVGGCLVGCSSFLRGWAGLAGGLSCGSCSGWAVLNLGSWLRFSLVVQVRPRVCWGCRVVAGSAGCVPCREVVLKLAVSFRWVGRPGRSGSSPPPSFSPHSTRRRLPGPRIQWVNSHVKTLTDRRSSVSGAYTFRLYRTV
nr:MAG TPA: Friend leukemia integration 1 transcription-free protein synthesis, protein regulation [Caudoviricetes sp.]